MSEPLNRLIVVVRRDQPELYARMRELYGDVAVVILDRRRAARRRPRVAGDDDRQRRGDRRDPWTAADMKRWRVLGYRLIYRAKGIEADPTGHDRTP
jgi:hypothetical protein